MGEGWVTTHAIQCVPMRASSRAFKSGIMHAPLGLTAMVIGTAGMTPSSCASCASISDVTMWMVGSAEPNSTSIRPCAV